MATRIAVMKAFGFLLLAFAAQPLVAQDTHPGCLRYEPDTVRVTGTLARHMYYGAPGYGEDPKHDEKEVGFYLELTRPLCMASGGDDVNVPKTGIARIQLLVDEKGYGRLRPFLGKRITLRGTLFGAITGHHHTPVLLSVLKPVQPGH